MAEPEHLAKLALGDDGWNTWRIDGPNEIDLRGAELNGVLLRNYYLRNACLSGADLRGAKLTAVELSWADMRGSKLIEAKITLSTLNEADLTGAAASNAGFDGSNLIRTKLRDADLTRASFFQADLREAYLNGADLTETRLWFANLKDAKLIGADLTNASLYSACLQGADLTGATLTDASLWETQRAGWIIKNVVCERVFWDEERKVATTYAPGEFERLPSQQNSVELFYEGGVSPFELNTLPALLQHLATLHPGENVRLKSIVETGSGAKITIGMDSSDEIVVGDVKADALKVFQAQLALRDEEVKRLQFERDYIERQNDKLIAAMLVARPAQNVFIAPFTGMLVSGGTDLRVQQTIKDDTGALSLLEKMIAGRGELGFGGEDAERLEDELHGVKAELEKKEPDPSLVAKGIGFIEKMAGEAAMKAAGKLGEDAVGDWHGWLNQLGQIVHHWK